MHDAPRDIAQGRSLAIAESALGDMHRTDRVAGLEEDGKRERRSRILWTDLEYPVERDLAGFAKSAESGLPGYLAQVGLLGQCSQGGLS